MKNAYPVVFYDDEGSVGVVVPDVKGCHTFGEDMSEAIEMAEDAIEMMIASMEDDGEEIPKPSTIAQTEKRLRSGEIEVPGENPEISYVRINTDKWRAENSEKSIRKNVTIPEWLCRKAEKANVNFSQLLQNSLKKYLNVD